MAKWCVLYYRVKQIDLLASILTQFQKPATRAMQMSEREKKVEWQLCTCKIVLMNGGTGNFGH